MTVSHAEAVRRLTWLLRQAEQDRDWAAGRIRVDLDAGATSIIHRARDLARSGEGVRHYGTAVMMMRGQDADVDADDIAYWEVQAEDAERTGESYVISRIIEALTQHEFVTYGDLIL